MTRLRRPDARHAATAHLVGPTTDRRRDRSWGILGDLATCLRCDPLPDPMTGQPRRTR
jgi:hypothetical protein